MLLNRFSKSRTLAKFFAGMKIKGLKGEECHCPVAKYLGMIYPDALKIVVHDDRAYIYLPRGGSSMERRHYPHEVSIRLRLSPIVTAFIEEFDKGGYPELDGYQRR